MKKEIIIVGFIGAGGIARSHAYSLNSLKYYYDDIPDIRLEAVCSSRPESRSSFAKLYEFEKAIDLNEFVADNKINTVFVLGPNKVHYEHLKAVTKMSALKRIYLEKPVCSNKNEEKAIAELVCNYPNLKIQVGFQFLFSSVIRDMLGFWKSGTLGAPIHFDLKYYHGDYLRREYREKRAVRLSPAPEGGAMADLGSHSLSLLIALLGGQIRITSAVQGGHFSDVREDSDLFSLISIFDVASGAVGTISASRISSGTGDFFSLDLFADRGALRYSTLSPDYYEFYTEGSGVWTRRVTGSNFSPLSIFPSGHVPSGWLRSMIHAQYVFLTGKDKNEFVPDIEHGLAVQRMVSETAVHLEAFRKQVEMG